MLLYDPWARADTTTGVGPVVGAGGAGSKVTVVVLGTTDGAVSPVGLADRPAMFTVAEMMTTAEAAMIEP